MLRSLAFRKSLKVFSALFVCSALLAACGAASGPTQPATPAAGAATAPAAAPAAAAATVVPAAAATTAPAAAPAPSTSSGTLRIAAARNISVLDGIGGGVQSTTTFLQMYDVLCELGPDLQLRPGLALSWEAVDPTTWRFTLRQGVKFHNGEDFNADVVKFNIDRLVAADPRYTYANNWGVGWPPSVEVESPYSVLLKTPKPQPAVPRLLDRVGMIPMSAANNPDFFKKAIGTGPYKFVSWEPGVRLTMEANLDYWGGAPKIQQIVYDIVTDPTARVSGLLAGEYQLAIEIPFDRLEEVSSAPDLMVVEEETLGLDFITFNGRAPKSSPISDVRIRRALTYAIDQQGIRETILKGRGEYSRGPSSALALGAVDAGGYPARDVEMAKKLLAEAGYDGTELTFISSGNDIYKENEIAEAVIAQLAEAGVPVKFERLEGAAFTERRPTPNWDLAPNGVPGAFTGEAPYHYAQLKAQQGFERANIEELLVKADAPGNTPEQRLSLIQQAMKAMWDEVPYLWSIGKIQALGVSKKLKGYEYIPVQWINFRDAYFEQ